jgi:hypothetical protein
MKLKLNCHWLLLVTAVTLTAAAPTDNPEANPVKQRIGVYDSRAVAVAFAGSEAQNKWMEPLIAQHEKAKAAGDTKRVKEIEAEGKARQKRAHTQAFATAPVDDILDHIKEELPGIKSQAGVSVLVSKWDKKQLARHRSAEQIDVTAALIDAFHPNERQRKNAIEIQKHKPTSFWRAKQIRD